jgi:FkbM family methyltransferase
LSPSSSTNQLKRFVTLAADLGVADGARLALREFGIRTYQSMMYPGLERKFEVQFDPVWRWIQRGIRERGLLKIARDRISKGSMVIDVGAHVGESALLFSELTGPSGRVIAFEPDPVACASLRKNLEMNGVSNVFVEEECASDRTGKVLLATERFGSGLSSIVRPEGGGTRRKTIEVASTTLDTYCETHGLSPDWIKVDAEGAEPLIVRGMNHIIEKSRPSMILEFHSDDLTDDERSKAWSVITSRASGVSVLESIPTNYAYLEELPKGVVPDRGFLLVYIRY